MKYLNAKVGDSIRLSFANKQYDGTIVKLERKKAGKDNQWPSRYISVKFYVGSPLPVNARWACLTFYDNHMILGSYNRYTQSNRLRKSGGFRGKWSKVGLMKRTSIVFFSGDKGEQKFSMTLA